MGEMHSVELAADAELAYTGVWMSGLRGQRMFRELDLADADDAVLGEVAEMTWLRVLKARGPFTDEGVRRLTGLRELFDLWLDSDRIEGEFTPPDSPLRVMSLSGAALEDRSLRLVGRYPDLRVVRWSSDTATGDGLGWLPLGVRMLYLRLPRLDVERLTTLAQLPYLGTLTFSGTAPTPELSALLAGLGGELSRVDFLGVERPEPAAIRPLAEAGIKVNTAQPV
ncbi:hypothetical protein EDD29_6550 [Actinocorallia herbida]|uniref:Leucine rich repeat (LRR) protein n=1 Tax=Actinocorallia herbida TaxID=58109 RepID=A0A3N1D5Y3_9ACTN|nr:hypothetical protein [Actinocorallia herbida]ROO88866.1 hypothetical protein EDD29_6550 [Actinocorallia herbida]